MDRLQGTARLYHQDRWPLYLWIPLYKLYGGVNAASGLRTVLEVNSIVATVGHTGNPATRTTMFHLETIRRCSAAMRASVHVLRECASLRASCRGSHQAIQPGWHRHLDQCRNGCGAVTNQKASRTPSRRRITHWVPFTPTYAEYIFLKDGVCRGQMEYLCHFPARAVARPHPTLLS